MQKEMDEKTAAAFRRELTVKLVELRKDLKNCLDLLALQRKLIPQGVKGQFSPPYCDDIAVPIKELLASIERNFHESAGVNDLE